MLYFLMFDNGMDTGESFRTIEEVHQWFYDVIGNWPKRDVKGQMRNGESFNVGSRSYKLERRKSHSLNAVAA